ncbi:Wilms tumor protein 1-interacting protein homolog isoform X1 [Hippocampus zosterae]|uniref:Wilms tumor protein 1-interacting protein homolog isoform X1 n=1 Tax=Hippocampus zosterae TaxID=109293 RepID=UPI00223D26BA|nr:Wilms tumor protein 1-interacting protein homolog isoform X1 [Hippocampus zosterae]XP_051920296.1 Wilms tumor protein 1-interacting protein homolog isoform X1 [Hippocampus zosterae]
MEHYQHDVDLRAGQMMDELSLYDAYRRQDAAGRDLDSTATALRQQHHTVENFTSANKVYNAAPVRPVQCSRTVPVDFCTPQREAGYAEEGCCKSEVALPCYTGASERQRRYSLEVHRYSTGSAFDAFHKPLPLPGNRCNSVCMDGRHHSPRSSLASSCVSSQEQSKHASPRASLVVAVPSLVHCEGSSVLSPRSSYASTASDTSKHSSPRTSLNSCDCCSKPSSNRTSGISMGYDQRHTSPRSSTASQYSFTTSPRSSYSDSRYGPHVRDEFEGAAPLVASPRSSICSQDGSARAPVCVLSPRSSISSHSSRSSRSSRGSMSTYPDLQLPSPRASMLGGHDDSLLHELGDPNGMHPRLHVQEHPSSLEVTSKTPTVGQRFKVPYQVTPSRESGPSQAERRLEALTLELEKELEMHMKKEYFGICIKCGKGVYGASQACQAMGNLYHTNCFTCCSCGRRLRGKAFYNVNGKVYCEEDFLYSGFQQTAEKCFVCGHLIMEMILQALGKSYHPGCFRCVVCKEGLDGVPFTVDVENNIYCVKDYHTVFAPKCASCNQPILPAQGSEETIRVVSMDKDYHVECYHCEDCGLQLNDEEGHRCYPLDGHLLCHGCHIRRLQSEVPGHPPPSYPLHVTEL